MSVDGPVEGQFEGPSVERSIDMVGQPAVFEFGGGKTYNTAGLDGILF
jgi:hypothetical protein